MPTLNPQTYQEPHFHTYNAWVRIGEMSPQLSLRKASQKACLAGLHAGLRLTEGNPGVVTGFLGCSARNNAGVQRLATYQVVQLGIGVQIE